MSLLNPKLSSRLCQLYQTNSINYLFTYWICGRHAWSGVQLIWKLLRSPCEGMSSISERACCIRLTDPGHRIAWKQCLTKNWLCCCCITNVEHLSTECWMSYIVLMLDESIWLSRYIFSTFHRFPVVCIQYMCSAWQRALWSWPRG